MSTAEKKIVGLLLLLLLMPACTERRQLRLLREAEEKSDQGRYGEAVDKLKLLVSLNPESESAIKAIFRLGFTLETYLKDYEGALVNYQEFIRVGRDKVSVYEVQKRIATIYFEHYRDPDKSIAAYKRLLASSPESLEADLFQFRIARAFFQQNNFENARQEYQELLEKFPRSQFAARARYEIGNCYYMDNKYDTAIEALKQVLRLHPQSQYATEAEFLMAQCYEQLEKLQNAFQIYENLMGRYSSPGIVEARVSALKRRLNVKP